MAESSKLYRFLLKLYPARFREEFGGPLEREFADERADAAHPLGFWIRVLADLAWSIPREFAREIFCDLRYSFRVYARRPLVTILAVTALAMAIGVTTGVFSVLNALLLRSLPFRDPSSLVMLNNLMVPRDRVVFQQWAHSSGYLEDAALQTSREMSVARAGDTSGAARVGVAETSANVFSLLGNDPEFGRGFAADEDQPGKPLIAVISYAFFEQYFGGDPRALGAAITINDEPATIIGVARPGFDYPNHSAVWVPVAFDPVRIPMKMGGGIFFSKIARLKPGMSIANTREALCADGRAFLPNFDFASHPGEYPEMRSLGETLARPIRNASTILLCGVVFVLLIACANIANLLLARVADRKPEMAVRAALGASRARLVQQLITESIVLAGLAAIAGLLIADWTAKLAASVQPAPLGTQSYSILDWRVLVFSVVIAGVTGLLFGVFPAWLISRTQPGDSIHVKSTAQPTSAGKFRGALIAMQVALTLMLVAGSFAMCRSFLNLLGTDLGFKIDHTITMNVSLIGSRYDTPAKRALYFADALQRLRSVPGVDEASGIEYIPLGDFASTPFGIVPATFDDAPIDAMVMGMTVGPGFFQLIGDPLIAGREIEAGDAQGDAIAVINEGLARRLGDPRHLLGHRINVNKQTATIVGVARNIAFGGPEYAGSESTGHPLAFLSAPKAPPDFLTLLAKVHGDASRYLAPARDAVQSADPKVAVFNARLFSQYLADTLARPRFYTTAILFLGAFAVLLAIIGIYGVASYSVGQRTHELGVRMAIGASPVGLRWMILRQSLRPVGIGVVIGLIGSAWLGQLLRTFNNNAEPVSGAISIGAGVLLAATAAIAAWSATRRIVRVDPLRALRSE